MIMREADDEIARLCRTFVDRRDTAAGVGDISAPLASGAITKEDVVAALIGAIVAEQVSGTEFQALALIQTGKRAVASWAQGERPSAA